MTHLPAACGFVSALFLAVAALPASVHGQAHRVASPGGKVEISVEIKDNKAKHPGERRLYWSVTYNGHPVLVDSTFALEFRDMPPLGRGLSGQEQRAPRPSARRGRESGESARTSPMRPTSSGSTWKRPALPGGRSPSFSGPMTTAPRSGTYVPEQTAFSDFRLAAERSEFAFAGIPRVWAADYGGFVSHQESEFVETAINDLSPDKPYGLPMLVKSDGDFWAAVTEADLLDWAGMYLTRDSVRDQLARHRPLAPSGRAWRRRPFPDAATVALARRHAGRTSRGPHRIRPHRQPERAVRHRRYLLDQAGTGGLGPLVVRRLPSRMRISRSA